MADPGRGVPRLRIDRSEVSMQARDSAGAPLPDGVAFDDPQVSTVAATRRYPRGSTIDVALDWEIDGLPVWRAARTVLVDGDTTIRISSGEYRTDALDTDADGHDNFAELTAGSDPRDAGSTPQTDGVAADFAGEWVGIFVLNSDLSTWFSYRDSEAFFEALDENESGAEDDIVVDGFYFRIDASGALTSFDERFDEYATVSQSETFSDCVVRYTGTITAVSDERYVVDAGPVFRFGSEPVLIERRRADPEAGDSLWFSDDGEFWVPLQPYSNEVPLDSRADC